MTFASVFAVLFIREKKVNWSMRKGPGTKHHAAGPPGLSLNTRDCAQRQCVPLQPLASHVALPKSLTLLNVLVHKMNTT